MRLSYALAVVALLGATIDGAAETAFLQLGEGWTLVQFRSEDDATLRMVVDYQGPSIVFGFAYVGTEAMGGVGSFILGSDGSGVDLDTDVVGSSLHPTSATDGTVNLGLLQDAGLERNYIILFAGGIDRVRVSVEGMGEATLLASGPLHSYTGAELDGGAWARVQGEDTSFHLAAARVLEFDVQHTLVGGFGLPPLLGAYAGMTLTSPNGTDHCANYILQSILEEAGVESDPCLPQWFSGPEHRGAGHYRLDWTGAGGSLGNTPIIAWADIEWPGAVI